MAHEQHAPALHGIMAEFDTPSALVEATNKARLHGFRNMDAYTPIPIEELNEALAAKGIGTQEALADCATDDVTEQTGLDAERATQLIMAARAPWFAEANS